MKIKSYSELEEIVNNIRTKIALNADLGCVEHFRGQSSNDFKLLSGLGRCNFTSEKVVIKEKNVFEEFKYQVKIGNFDFIQEPYSPKKYPFKEDWFYLFQAQHIGLITRMTDWTRRFEVALYFSVENEELFGQDAQFWYFLIPQEFICNVNTNLKSVYETHPFSNEKNLMINHPYYQNEHKINKTAEVRRLNQSGIFFIQSSDKINIPLEEQEDLKPYLQKFIIDGKSKQSIKKELISRGITKEWIYPEDDLDIKTLEIKKKINCLNKSM